jgi:hypothetical protein
MKCFLSKLLNFNENEKAHNIHVYSTFLTVFSTPYILTVSDQFGQTHRKSTQNTESTLGLAAAAEIRGLRVLMRKKIVIKKNNYNNTVTLSGFILLTDNQGGPATQV